jgi:hypothetical protein
MRELASESGWIILSGDVAIGRNPHEVAAWKAAGHTIFLLKAGWTNIEFWPQVQKLARYFPEIIVLARKAKPGELQACTPCATQSFTTRCKLERRSWPARTRRQNRRKSSEFSGPVYRIFVLWTLVVLRVDKMQKNPTRT